MKRTLSAFVLALSIHNAVGAVEKSGWPNWRGPNGDGTAAAGHYAVKWSETDKYGWSVKLAGRGASTPVVVGDRIIVTGVTDKTNVVQCFDLSGKSLWNIETGEARAGKHKKATGSNSSPVSDGKLVVSYFKSGDLICTDLDGKTIWSLNLQQKFGEDTLWWDLGTSPVLTDNAVVIAVMQSGPSFLLALDKSTGEKLWQADRAMNAPEEANHSYSTPIVTELDGKQVLLTLGADHLTCHAAVDGKLLWKVGGFNPGGERFFRSIASPVLAGDLVVCPYSRGNTLTAVRLHAKSDEDRIAWKRTDLGSDVPTPTVSGGRLYVVGDRGVLNCLDVATGKTIWSEQLPKSRVAYSSAPIVAGGAVYVTREDAATFVAKDSDKFELLSENKVPGETVATPVFVNDQVLVRTYDHLISIGSK
ncbi:MAG: PQQ-binding-like beta-propeller repeat protein [Pirellulales bacterium]